jgi:hypothetical protein
MTAPHRGRHADPVDRVESYAISSTATTPADRDSARDGIVRRATSMADLGRLLAALGLDDPAELLAQLNPQGDAA